MEKHTEPEVVRFERPSTLLGVTSKIRTAHGNFYPTVSRHEGKIIEVFCRLGKAGGCDYAYLEAIGRLVSIGLQCGVPLEDLVSQLQGITCHPYQLGGDGENFGPVDALGRLLQRLQEEGVDT